MTSAHRSGTAGLFEPLRAWLVSALSALAALAVAACEPSVAAPREQWFVAIATDTVVPQFGDRLVVELLDAEGDVCNGCSRVFGVAAAQDWPVSFGVVPPEGADGPFRVRARLFRADWQDYQGDVPAGLGLDALAVLPDPNGVTNVALELPMDCFGVTADVQGSMTCDPASATLVDAPTLRALADHGALLDPGDWPFAMPMPCTSSPPEDMVCVPGGVFLMGDQRGIGVGLPETTAQPLRLVRVSPLAMDIDEVSVRTVRLLVRDEGFPAPVAFNPNDGLSSACHYLSSGDDSNDDLPINCISFGNAALLCERLGKRLPTEAEWEHAAGNRRAETTYPWGDEVDVCERAIVGRGRTMAGEELREVTTCRTTDGLTRPPGPVAGGHDGDVTLLGVRNLSGNMSEWIADELSPLDGPCWHPEQTMLVNPICEAGTLPTHGLRGGSWAGHEFAARAFERGGSLIDGPLPVIGVRCVQQQ